MAFFVGRKRTWVNLPPKAWIGHDKRHKTDIRDDTRVPDGHEERDLGCIFSGELSSAFDCRAGSGLSYDVGDR